MNRSLLSKRISSSYESSDSQKHDEHDILKEKFLNKIVCGDSYFLLQKIPDNSIHLTITSPPYFQQRNYDGLGIGNEKAVEGYFENLLKIFDECVRITKDAGSIVFRL